ncbi:phosphoadenosine phosphosulfate reductase family protein [Leptothoe sp. ISB3NOV94-8A]
MRNLSLFETERLSLETGRIPQPESVTILHADTRQELPPLHNAAMNLLDKLRSQGFDTRVVLPELDHRYFVYMLGRGVPPPSNTFRWCTPKLKVMSMERELETLRQERGEKFLMLTGVRIGESAARDQRIAMSCTKDGDECGQGWFQHSSANAVADTLAPLLHWRVCHIWDWLVQADVDLGYPTFAIAEVYGHDPQDELGETEPMNARTGCIGCPLVQKDSALDRVVANPKWAYLAPLQQLRPLYWRIKQPQYRLRKHGELRKDGTLAKKQGRQVIQAKNLYTFNAKSPRQIVRSAIERRCDSEGKKRTVSPAWFTKLPDKRYALKQEVS